MRTNHGKTAMLLADYLLGQRPAELVSVVDEIIS